MDRPDALPLPLAVRRYFADIRRSARAVMDGPEVDDATYRVAADCLELAEEAEVQMATIIVLTRMLCRLQDDAGQT